MTTVSGNRKALATITAGDVHIQPLTGDKVELMGGVLGKTFRIWTDPELDIQEGDTLRDSNSIYYVVANGGVSRRTFGSFDYKEVLIKEV